MAKSGLIRQHQSKLSFLQRIFDALIIGSNLFILTLLRGSSWSMDYTLVAVSAIAVFFFLAESNVLYQSWRGVSISMEIRRIANAWIFTALVLLLIAFATKSTSTYSRIVIVSWLISTPILLSLFRIVLRRTLMAFRVLGYNTRTVAIVGAGNLGKVIAESILDRPWMGLNLVGFYSDEQPKDYQPIARSTASVMGKIKDLVSESGDIDLVYVTLPMREESKIFELIQGMGDSTSSLYLVPDLFTFDLLHSRWTEISGMPVISIYESPFRGVDGWVKKLEDIILGLVLTMIAIVPMLTIALAVKLTSKGPVLFKQRRCGLNGEEIVVWKFRTMSVTEDEGNIQQARKGDSRITGLGKLLRRTSLDELPQFINVLQGRMSIVGPRPHAVAHNEEYRKLVPSYMLRHKVKPGITGWAQVHGWRGETDTIDKMENRVQYDLEYIRNWSLWLDLKIIVQTIFFGFKHKNAY